MHCKSLWIKASAKCINVNVNCAALRVEPGLYSPCQQECECARGKNYTNIEEMMDCFHAKVKGRFLNQM